jgi:GH43 family beta-xylosidase
MNATGERRPMILVGVVVVMTLALALLVFVGIPLALLGFQKAREAARRQQAENMLKQVGLALENYEQRYSAEKGGAAKTYCNPVGEKPLHMGDPFVLKHDGVYYLFGTNASNEGFKCWTSTNLAEWQDIGWAYRETVDSWAKSHYWAPEVERYRDKFYLTYSAMNKAEDPPRLLMALAVSDNPQGPYKDLHAPWFDFSYSTIDSHLFVDDDNQVYLYFSRNGAQDGYSFGEMYGVAMSDDLSKPIGEPIKLMEADQRWERVRYAENRCNEGAFVIKHDGRYYMTYSANHTAFPHYGIGYATADQPLGPWVKAEENPIAATNQALGISGPGHSCLVASPDEQELFIVYHSHANPLKPSGDRVVNIDRIEFKEDGTLQILGPTRSEQPLPSGCP